MRENKELYENEILDYYTELIKTTYLKENQNLGINARNKVIAQYNRLMQEEKVANINSLITRIGNKETLSAISTAAYISTVESVSPLLHVYANVQIYVSIKSQFLNQSVDPLQVIATFDPSIWHNENIQNYANAALEYNKYSLMLNSAMDKINAQTRVSKKVAK